MSFKFRALLMLLIDAALVGGIYWLVLLYRAGGTPSPSTVEAFVPVAVAAIFFTVLLLYVYDAYQDLHQSLLDTLTAVLVASTLATFLTLAVPYTLQYSGFPRSIFLIALPLLPIMLFLARLPWIQKERLAMAQKRVAVIGGDRQQLERLCRALSAQFGAQNLLPLYNGQWADVVAAKPDMVVVGPEVDVQQRQQIHEWCVCNFVACLLVPKLTELLMARSRLTRLGELPAFASRQPSLSPDHVLFKRVFDLAAAVVIGVAALPLVAASALIIKAVEPSAPVLYRQRRVGLGGRTFTLYKFRTMIPNAEEETGPVLADEDDDRVTPVGRLLRKTRLDELPQIWNVLKGDMSLVGPRPERPEFVEEFASRTSLYRLRHNVRPGITGLAQVLGNYHTDYRDKLRYDLLYVAFASPFLDLKVALLTLRVMFFPIERPSRVSALLERFLLVSSK